MGMHKTFTKQIKQLGQKKSLQKHIYQRQRKKAGWGLCQKSKLFCEWGTKTDNWMTAKMKKKVNKISRMRS